MKAASALSELIASLHDGARLAETIAGPFKRSIRRHPQRGNLSPGWGALEAIPWSPTGYWHADDIDPGSLLDYHTGLAWPQDAASQLPVELLAPQAGEVVIDCCAAPGSKSTQIGLALGDDGLLICCDASKPRRAVLAETLARQGIACALVTPVSVQRLAERVPACADAVLVDAPCSGHVERSERQVARMAAKQLSLLIQASALVRPGGRLVYSTCTPYAAEDEGVIEAFLAQAPGWVVEPHAAVGVDADCSSLGAARLWPQRQGTEPFFACRLRAPGDAAGVRLLGQLPQAAPAIRDDLPSAWHCWERGGLLLAATPMVAQCPLPSEARGLILARNGKLEGWAAQALIARGSAAQVVSHADGCALWAGAECGLPSNSLIETEHGAPLGISDAQGRLRLPSRMRRDHLR